MEAGLLRFARNDMKISESHVSTSKVSFLNLDLQIRAKAPVLLKYSVFVNCVFRQNVSCREVLTKAGFPILWLTG